MKFNPKKMLKMMKERPKDLPETLKCLECDFNMQIPHHCRASMHFDDDLLVCWMGKECCYQEIPKHHNLPMIISK